MNRPLIGILRGITPDEIEQATNILLDAGINRIEVPLNSPDPYQSIEQMIQKFKGQGIFGAGTVTEVSEVEKLADIGCEMILAPNCNSDVILAAKQANMRAYPGVMTPTECFVALKAGADGLKFFPGDLIGIDGLKAMKAILPKTADCFVVGGANTSNFKNWLEAGATGFGIGSALYKAGMTMDALQHQAKDIVAAYDSAMTD